MTKAKSFELQTLGKIDDMLEALEESDGVDAVARVLTYVSLRRGYALHDTLPANCVKKDPEA